MKCIVCNRENDSLLKPCSRCGFVQPAVVGDAAGAEAYIMEKARKHKQELLERFDFGLTVYHWKDENGKVVLDREERLSFGKGDGLLAEPVWLEQQFARIPDMDTMELELSIQDGQDTRKRPMSIPAPQGKHLQQVGAGIDEDLTLRLMLKNPEGQTQSAPVWFLSE